MSLPGAHSLCRFGFRCGRSDCWFEHPEGRAIDARSPPPTTLGGKGSRPAHSSSEWQEAPRQKNAQVVVLSQFAQDMHVLLQLRSMNMPVMPGHLATVGGMRDRRDRDSRCTALREASEETGLVDLGHLRGAAHRLRSRAVALGANPPVAFAKFGEGANVDWWVVELDGAGTFEAHAEDAHECDDIRPLIPSLPIGTFAAHSFGHAWVPVRRLHELDPSLPLMGGLVRRINEGYSALHRSF
eukprot:TRINITY_DN48519_c0_g1_i1.p1 TRINITY_DN48519_c0_g1~~TRINITY_DN48519_c0_g1_i1.p1  ORF type:complete len:241 (-),score=18.12 TRINITY_DN48519_c0_g1_i1:57-779(-)